MKSEEPAAPDLLNSPSSENAYRALVEEMRGACQRIGETAISFKAYVDAAQAKEIHLPAAKNDLRSLFQ
jgi:hypothetical protein